MPPDVHRLFHPATLRGQKNSLCTNSPHLGVWLFGVFEAVQADFFDVQDGLHLA
jgi:hypothetical protein